MKHKHVILILAAALLAAMGCTPAVQKPSSGAAEPPATDADVRASYSAAARSSSATFLDTLNRGNEIALTDSDLPTLEVTAVAALPAASAPRGETRFRIQILASSQVDMVRQEKLNAEAALGLPVFMASEQSLYKLYAGDFKTKADAEAALPGVKSKGYRDAWVVTIKN